MSNRLRPAFDAKFREKVHEMGLYRRFGHEEGAGNFAIGCPVPQQAQHVELALGEAVGRERIKVVARDEMLRISRA